jgi:hypothetical protein
MPDQSWVRRQQGREPFSGAQASSKLTFPTGIHDHQNNSFDEFRERGYARAHREDAAL